MASQNATLKVNGLTIELPMHQPTTGYPVIDVRKLTENELFTYDPGFVSTAACESKITYIDGDKGILLYRGYPIEQLAQQSDYMSVCYLLMHGELPANKEKKEFVDIIRYHTLIHEQVYNFINGFRRDAHPMAMLLSIVGALSSFYHDSLDINDAKQREKAAYLLIAKIPTIAAICYKYNVGQPFIYPRNDLSFTENFLHMMFGLPTEEKQFNPTLVRALDRIFTLHADHEQNASTSTVRLAGSTGANPFACIAAGIAALWGPAHGGANEACLNMLQEIGNVKNIDQFIKRAKDKNDPFRLMGFGHRVYKNYDPRATVMRDTCHEVLKATKSADDPLFQIALKLEKIALEDPYFIERKLYPNVDFYSGITLRALGIPNNMFTVIFALARTVGWISHWLEMMNETPLKIGRPRQLYTGPKSRKILSTKKK